MEAKLNVVILEDHNLTKKRKVLKVFNGIIADIKANERIKSYNH